MPKKRLMPIVGLILALSALWLILYPGRLQGEPPPGAEAQPGFKLYKEYCARCHGLDGRSVRSSRIAERSVSLVDPLWKSKAEAAEIRRVIVDGEGKMKGFGDDLAPAEVDRITSYLLWMPTDTSAAP